MKRKIGIMVLLMVSVVIFSAVQNAKAAALSEANFDEFLAKFLNKTAAGTKLTGTLTIYYDYSSGQTCSGGYGPSTEMNYFLRLRKGAKLYSFSGQTPSVCYLDFNTQVTVIQNFLRNNVINTLYPASTPYAVKSADQIVQDDDFGNPGCCGGMLFNMMDIELAVQD